MQTLARMVFAAATSVSASLLAGAAQAKVHITVDLDRQTIHVEARDQVFDWKISSGKPGYETPAGKFGVLWMDKDHHSDEYEQAPMPNAIFFAPGYAIHGFTKSPWGHKASHGCVRLPVAKAEILFDLVEAEGAEVDIVGQSTGIVAAAPVTHRDPPADGIAGAYGANETLGYPTRQDLDNPVRGRSGGADALFGTVY